ncbi:MAG: hypothetical protein J7L12_02645 [Desulfurococcales archaeon]|nr:hypothetical protein [Desulfurococcales archaeon]
MVVNLKLMAMPLILILALGMLVPATTLAQSTNGVAAADAQAPPEAVPVVANGSYARILNHSITLAERLLTMWNITPGTEPWVMINEAKELLNNITIAEEEGNRTLARQLFIEGMSKVRSAISLAAKEYLPEPQKERLRIRVRTRTCLQLVNALNASVRALEKALVRAQSREMINASLATELRAMLGNASEKLLEVKQYLARVMNGTAEWDEEYLNTTIGEVKDILRYVSTELNEAIAATLAEKIEARVAEILNSTEKAIEELRENAQKLREMGLVKVANRLETVADRLSHELEKIEGMIEEKLNMSKMRLITHLGKLERIAYAMRVQAALRHRIARHGIIIGYNISNAVKAVETVISYVESHVMANPEVPDDIKEAVSEIANLSKEVISELKTLAGAVAAGDEEGAAESINKVKELMEQIREKVADLKKEAGHGKPYLRILTAVISRVEGMLNSITNYVIGHAERTLHTAKEAGGEKHLSAYALIDRALRLVKDALKMSKMHVCKITESAKEMLENAEEALDHAEDLVKEGSVEDAISALNQALSYLSSAKEDVKCTFIVNHIEVAMEHINAALSILQE